MYDKSLVAAANIQRAPMPIWVVQISIDGQPKFWGQQPNFTTIHSMFWYAACFTNVATQNHHHLVIPKHEIYQTKNAHSKLIRRLTSSSPLDKTGLKANFYALVLLQFAKPIRKFVEHAKSCASKDSTVHWTRLSICLGISAAAATSSSSSLGSFMLIISVESYKMCIY